MTSQHSMQFKKEKSSVVNGNFLYGCDFYHFQRPSRGITKAIVKKNFFLFKKSLQVFVGQNVAARQFLLCSKYQIPQVENALLLSSFVAQTARIFSTFSKLTNHRVCNSSQICKAPAVATSKALKTFCYKYKRTLGAFLSA